MFRGFSYGTYVHMRCSFDGSYSRNDGEDLRNFFGVSDLPTPIHKIFNRRYES